MTAEIVGYREAVNGKSLISWYVARVGTTKGFDPSKRAHPAAAKRRGRAR